MTSEKGLSILDAVALYKELTDVESGFRQLKDVLAMRPIYHQIEPRVKAHIFVAALALYAFTPWSTIVRWRNFRACESVTLLHVSWTFDRANRGVAGRAH